MAYISKPWHIKTQISARLDTGPLGISKKILNWPLKYTITKVLAVKTDIKHGTYLDQRYIQKTLKNDDASRLVSHKTDRPNYGRVDMIEMNINRDSFLHQYIVWYAKYEHIKLHNETDPIQTMFLLLHITLDQMCKQLTNYLTKLCFILVLQLVNWPILWVDNMIWFHLLI